MPDVSDIDLLRQYAQHGSEEAFTALVRQHVNLVYSAALRHVGVAAHAEEITQAVFIILAQKAGDLRPDTILEAWLYKTARLTSLSFLRGERRRQIREQEAVMQSALDKSDESPSWNQLAPLLDAAMARLAEKDRNAVVLRFFKGKSLPEVAAALQITEAAAQSRVHRAVSKLHDYFRRHGVHSTAEAIAGAVAVSSVQAAPVAVVKSVTAIALLKGASAPVSTLALIKGVSKILAWTQAKTALTFGAVLLLAAGTTTVVLQYQGQAAGVVDLPKSSWVFAGYGSPAATLQTMEWAVSRLDGTALLNGLSADCQQEFRDFLMQSKPGMSLERFLLDQWAREQDRHSDIRLVKQEVLTPDRVLVQLALRGQGGSQDRWLKFRRFESDWKIDDFDPKGPNSRTGLPHPNARYGGNGLVLEMDPATHAPRISKVVPDEALSHPELVPGRMVQKMNGTPTAGKTLAECVFLSRGRVGTEVVLELVDAGRQQTNAVVLTRRNITRADAVALGLAK